MGEARAKQYSREAFLKAHPRCCYCGAAATTTDHCPPRCFFPKRDWPEHYEFPACSPCNSEARLDEQALGVIVRIDALKSPTPSQFDEWKKLYQGVRNNQPTIAAEWSATREVHKKRSMREAFGEMGDRMRHEGYSSMNLGPQTRDAIDRFTVKLAKALYYLHVGKLLDGQIYHRYVDLIKAQQDHDVMETLTNWAPTIVEPARANRSVKDRFLYRLNFSYDPAVLHAVCRFSDQMVLQIFAWSYDARTGFDEFIKAQQKEAAPLIFVEAPLRFQDSV